MRSLLLFLGKYNAFFLFLILEGLALTMVVNTHWYQHSKIVNLQNNIAGKLYGFKDQTNEYFNLREANESLVAENTRLKTLIEGYENIDPLINIKERTVNFEGLTYTVFDTIKTKYKINDTLPARDTMYIIERRPKYNFIGANVINSSTNKQSNYITISKGSKQGIEKDMAVIGDKGVVGLINNVSDNYATIIPLLHKDVKLSAKIKTNDYPGSVVWDGRDPYFIDMINVPKHAAKIIQIGDTVVTKGSLLYPENIPVGVVQVSESDEGDNFATIRILLNTDFNKLHYVYVMKNKMLDEQKNLESKNKP